MNEMSRFLGLFQNTTFCYFHSHS